MVAPVRRGIAAETQPLELRIGRRPWHHVEDAHFQHVAWLGPTHEHGTGADMDAKSLAVALARAAAEHALPVLGPEIDALGAGIALDHALVIVARLVGQRLDGEDVARIDLNLRLEVLAEEAPMHRVGVGRQMMMLAARRALRQRPGRRAGNQAGGKTAFQERTPFARHVVLEPGEMRLEGGTGRIVTPAHEALLSASPKGRSRPSRRAPAP